MDALPAMGLSAEPEDQTTRERTSEMATHVVYGVVTETVRRVVREDAGVKCGYSSRKKRILSPFRVTTQFRLEPETITGWPRGVRRRCSVRRSQLMRVPVSSSIWEA